MLHGPGDQSGVHGLERPGSRPAPLERVYDASPDVVVALVDGRVEVGLQSQVLGHGRVYPVRRVHLPNTHVRAGVDNVHHCPSLSEEHDVQGIGPTGDGAYLVPFAEVVPVEDAHPLSGTGYDTVALAIGQLIVGERHARDVVSVHLDAIHGTAYATGLAGEGRVAEGALPADTTPHGPGLACDDHQKRTGRHPLYLLGPGPVVHS